ncbi:copper-binding protein [Achromobacter xylosoxidans]|uniref:copper-binding protein n=1 Tax=Alcaligenes xylosoxydans xylosoxydans TaxID=85698 RepID=UPI003F61907E
MPTAGAGKHKATGTVKTITPTEITISHGPVASIGWPAMTTAFKVPAPGVTQGVSVGEPVAFKFAL